MGIYDDGPFEVGDENEKNPDLVPAPANSYLGKSQLAPSIHPFPILHHHFKSLNCHKEAYSCTSLPLTLLCLHLPGFSLDSGKSLTKKGQLTVVAGAPRANHSGAVVLLKKGSDTSNILLKEYTLEGEGLASSFGYDLAVPDLNGDGCVTLGYTHKLLLLL